MHVCGRDGSEYPFSSKRWVLEAFGTITWTMRPNEPTHLEPYQRTISSNMTSYAKIPSAMASFANILLGLSPRTKFLLEAERKWMNIIELYFNEENVRLRKICALHVRHLYQFLINILMILLLKKYQWCW